jgi:hypothetical protein
MLPYLASAVLCYVASYVCCSTLGEFHPSVIGGNGVKEYMWSPEGFHAGFRQRWILYYLYLPLYRADMQYWHRYEDVCIGRYPARVPSTRAEWVDWKR